jgi:hypothetical protein
MQPKQFNVASCFSSFLLPHVLFVEDLELRMKGTMGCCVACPALLVQGFKQDLRMLVAQKHDLFP